MAALLVNTAAVSPTLPKLPFPTRTARRPGTSRCQASSSGGGGSSSSNGDGSGDRFRGRSGLGSTWVTEYDLYELLGVERSSPQSEIKAAYRSLQKRCHPDVAGAKGHDMAIVLNEVYSLLSDPAARLAYDKGQAKQSEFVGYTGKPLYSAWFGGESEQRAVFVDEVRCVGCLKCALYANKTFAVESVYGRARVVAQWADAEDKILDAIQTCPVDCISMVERSDLAALEFLMSKQPRGRVRVSEGNTVGARAPIFNEVDKFQKRFEEMKQKSATRESEESEAARQSRSSAVQSIRSISNWWYWRPFRAPATTVLASLHLPPPPPSSRPADPVTERLQEAAARRKEGGATAVAAAYTRRDDYWTPQLNLPSSASPPEQPHREAQRCFSQQQHAASNHRWQQSSRRRWRGGIGQHRPDGAAADGDHLGRVRGLQQGGGGRSRRHPGACRWRRRSWSREQLRAQGRVSLSDMVHHRRGYRRLHSVSREEPRELQKMK